MDRLLLMLPGPMQVPESIAAAAGKPLFFHRSEQFNRFRDALGNRIRSLHGADSAEILFLSACGTGAMESAMVNLTSPGQEIIVMVGGAFAERWVAIGKAFGLTVHAAEVDWRSGARASDSIQAMERWPAADVVFVTWSESSTGVLIDLPEMGRAVRKRRKLLVADAVSGLAVSPMEMDAWQVDTVISSSQKGLMMPAGLGLAAIGPRALERSRSASSPRFTWDWAPYLERVPVTPPLSLMHQLNASLDLMDSLGEGGIFRRRREVAETIRGLVRDADLEIFAKRPGDGITAVVAPENMDVERFIHRLEDDYSILIEGGPGRLAGKIFRIGHVGHLTNDELGYFCDSFTKALAAEMNR